MSTEAALIFGVIAIIATALISFYYGVSAGRARQRQEDEDNLYADLQQKQRLHQMEARTLERRLNPQSRPATRDSVIRPTSRDRTGLEDKNK